MNKGPKDQPISILFVGHIAIDNVIKDDKKNAPTLGGSVSYCSLSLRKYSKKPSIKIISNFNEKYFNNSKLRLLKEDNLDLEGLKLLNSEFTNFILKYNDHSRILKLKSRCPDLDYENIPDNYFKNPPDAIVLVPLCNEISYEYVSKIVESFPDAYIGMDIQGFIRTIDNDGNVLLKENRTLIEDLLEIVRLVGDRLIFKGSEEEMKLVSGQEDWIEIMEFFLDFDGIFIMTMGESGSMIAKKHHGICKIPAFKPKRVIDETGAGDVYLSIFMYEFIKSDKSWKSIKKIGLLASAGASFNVEEKGVNGFEKKEKVKRRVLIKQYITKNR